MFKSETTDLNILTIKYGNCFVIYSRVSLLFPLPQIIALGYYSIDLKLELLLRSVFSTRVCGKQRRYAPPAVFLTLK